MIRTLNRPQVTAALYWRRFCWISCFWIRLDPIASYIPQRRRRLLLIRDSSRPTSRSLVVAPFSAATSKSSSEKEFPRKTRKQIATKTTTKAPKRKTKKMKEDEKDAASSATKPTKKRASKAKKKDSPGKKKAKTAEKKTDSADTDKKPKKAPKHQVLTKRDEIPRLWDPSKAAENGSHAFKIAIWNVAGLRALIKKTPDALSELVIKHDLDVLCLQETKLQEQHLDDPKLKIRSQLLEEDGYDAYYSCSTAKKGYAGTAVFVRRRGGSTKKQKTLKNYFSATSKDETSSNKQDSLPIDVKELVPQDVSFKMGKSKHDAEGRLVVLDFPSFSLCNVYVPNSGQKLERLSYRCEEWDKDFLAFMQKKQADRGVPVMWLGDLNVAHTNLEVWNDGAKHLAKQAGVTPEERASFQEQLNAGFVDAFRRLHPTAAGHYTYWSQRAGNREPNKGLRLDYFIADPSFFEETSKVIVRDSFMDYDWQGSDHCPAILELEIKP